MDYTAGTDLVKHQWDAIHDPGPVIGMFERDEEGALIIFPCITNKPSIKGTEEGQLQIVKGSKTIPNGYGGETVQCEESYYYHIEDKPYTACCDENGRNVTVQPKYITDWYIEKKYCKDVIKPVLESFGILNEQVTCLHPESSKISAGYNLEQFFKDRPVSDDFIKTLETSYYSEICKDATNRLSGSGRIDRVYIEFDIILTFTGVGEVRALINYLRAKSFSQGAKLFASRTGKGIEILAREGGERIAVYSEGLLKEIRFIDEGGEILGTTGKIKFLDNEGKQAECVFQLIRKDGQIGLRKTVNIAGGADGISGLKSFTTQIDGKIKIIGKEVLYGNQAETFFNSEYVTAELVEDIMTYRRFGGNAKLGGSYVSTVEKLSREELALVEEFNNSMRFEAIIKVPKGETINIGKVGPWPPKAPEYMGGADQIILKYGYPENAWVQSIKDFNTGKIYTYGEYRKVFPNMCK